MKLQFVDQPGFLAERSFIRHVSPVDSQWAGRSILDFSPPDVPSVEAIEEAAKKHVPEGSAGAKVYVSPETGKVTLLGYYLGDGGAYHFSAPP